MFHSDSKKGDSYLPGFTSRSSAFPPSASDMLTWPAFKKFVRKIHTKLCSVSATITTTIPCLNHCAGTYGLHQQFKWGIHACVECDPCAEGNSSSISAGNYPCEHWPIFGQCLTRLTGYREARGYQAVGHFLSRSAANGQKRVGNTA